MPVPAGFPAHAYVPGQTPRHAEGAFDALRDTARPGMSVRDLAACPAFRTGLRYLDGGYYWEAHELLEPVWMALPSGSAERALVQGLIQIANGFLKLRMGRPRAARRLLQMARALCPPPEDGIIMGLTPARVHGWLEQLAEHSFSQNSA